VRLGTGLTVPYVAQGDRSGVPVLLLHAWGESLGSFDRLLPLLPSTIHALAMDQRGHGAADKPADGYALADFADDIVAFMDALGLSSAVLMGSSSGGYVAQQVAISEYYAITEDRVNALPDDKIMEIFKNGALAQIYAHLISLNAWDQLVARTLARGPMNLPTIPIQ